MLLSVTITCKHCDKHCHVLATERGTTTTVYCPQCERRYEIFVAEHRSATIHPPLPPRKETTHGQKTGQDRDCDTP